jgi:predicted GNAT family acetyltransferase
MDPSATGGAPEAMGAPETAPAVADNPAVSRYELHAGGELAGFVAYRLRGPVISLVHTEVDPRFQGAGYAARLARFSLDDARDRNLAVLPFCPYIQSWIRKHPEYSDLVPRERRAEFGL